ncbi:MAG: hypothetical protein HY658_13320 [Actinobacteria bacterium]|nr:hypothetical protein [Actinomycetota bacterium]
MKQLRLEEHGGTVSCPLRGEADLKTCVDCRFLDEVEVGEGARVVVCRPPSTYGLLGALSLPFPP